MKTRAYSFGVLIAVVALAVWAYVATSARAAAPLQSGGDALRWHIVTNPSDASKTFLIDSLVGETYLFHATGDTSSWKKMEKTK